MYTAEHPRRSERLPRIVLAGAYVDVLGARSDALSRELAQVAHVRHVAGRSMLSVYRVAARALSRDGFEAVHLLDARLAPVGAMLRARQGVPVSATVNPARVAGRGIGSHLARRALDRLDQGFASDHGTVRFLREHARRLPVVLTPAGSAPPQEPAPRKLSSISRLLRDVVPGRPVVGVPWTADIDYMRWHRDAVAPLLTGNPLCLLLGAPSSRQARLVFGANGVQADYRVHTGALDAETLAAAARCVDVFVVAGAPARPQIEPDMLMAMAASRVPLVVGGGLRSSILRHEANAFIATAGDPLSLVSTLNQVLALPAIQRHCLGEQFADYTLLQHTWEHAASVYAERFAVMVGRPPIPADLRAA
ncbi:MAG: hypothetical protein WEB52_06080 [Dehalococcoidia bacterium]